MSLDERQRTLLGELADVLIPTADDMPSASHAGVAGQWLDAVLQARPDLLVPLEALLEKAENDNAADAVGKLRADDPDAFGLLAEIVSNAYFMNPDVQRAVGYAGQEARAIDPRPDYMEDGLLESVIRRGAIYRPTPGGGEMGNGE